MALLCHRKEIINIITAGLCRTVTCACSMAGNPFLHMHAILTQFQLPRCFA